MRKPHPMSLGPRIPPLERVVQYDHAPGYVVFTMPVEKRTRVEAAGVTLDGKKLERPKTAFS